MSVIIKRNRFKPFAGTTVSTSPEFTSLRSMLPAGWVGSRFPAIYHSKCFVKNKCKCCYKFLISHKLFSTFGASWKIRSGKQGLRRSIKVTFRSNKTGYSWSQLKLQLHDATHNRPPAKAEEKLSFAFKADLSLFYEWICIISHCARWIFSNLHSPTRHKNHFCLRNTWNNIRRSDCTQMEFLSEMTWASLLPLSSESRKWNLWNFSKNFIDFPDFPPEWVSNLFSVSRR